MAGYVAPSHPGERAGAGAVCEVRNIAARVDSQDGSRGGGGPWKGARSAPPSAITDEAADGSCPQRKSINNG